MSAPGLASLLSIPPAHFVSEYWTKKPYIEHGAPERLAGIIDAPELASVQTLINTPNEMLRVDVRTLEGAPAVTFPKPIDAYKLYLAGNVVHVSAVDAVGFHPWISAMTKELGLPPGLIRFNVFASRRGEGVVPHFDAQDNFIIHLRGTKRWRIAPNTTIAYPVLNGTVDVPGASTSLSPNYLLPSATQERFGITDWPKQMPADAQVVDMKPGSVMYLPRGYWHAVETMGDESMHITVVGNVPTRLDAARRLLAEVIPELLSLDVAWREPLLDCWGEKGLREEAVRDVVARLVASIPKLLGPELAKKARAVLERERGHDGPAYKY